MLSGSSVAYSMSPVPSRSRRERGHASVPGVVHDTGGASCRTPLLNEVPGVLRPHVVRGQRQPYQFAAARRGTVSGKSP